MTTLNKKWAFDSNAIVYLLDSDSPFHKLSVSAATSAQKSRRQVYLTQQIVLETVTALTKWYRLNLKQAAKQAALVTKNYQIIHPKPHTYKTYLNLCQTITTHPKNHFDLYLAATLLDNHIHTIITNDPKGFANIPKLKVIPLSQFS